MSGEEAELEMDELTEITEYIQEKAGEEAEVIFGHGIDADLGAAIRVTVIATGFPREAGVIGNRPVTRAAAPQLDAFGAQVMADAATVTAAPPLASSFVQPAVENDYAVAASATEAPAAGDAPRPVTTFGLDYPAPAPTDVPVAPTRSGPVPDPSLVRRPNGLQPDEARFAHQGEDRRRRLRELSNGADVTSEEFKQKMEQPAYLRRNVALDQATPGAERKISRFSLTDDNELLGDNRFLHDNVD
jgi:cell division protein FtsZ